MIFVAALTLCIWLYLWLLHASFWKIDPEPMPPPPTQWPSVAVVIPARNEAQQIGETLQSLWGQDYPGEFRIVLVDDQSEDGTADAAKCAANVTGSEEKFNVMRSGPMPAGWVGKVWAMQEGVTRGIDVAFAGEFVLFSDADIHHGPGAMRELVIRAEGGGCDLVSFMVRLNCRSAAERLMIPAFVFFFRMLYPFRRANDPGDKMAGAAGGTMLVRREALTRIGGLESIRGELIDDCSLAEEIKRGRHRIWLGLTETSHSTRQYSSMNEIVHMIARTGYTQLDYSQLSLFMCIAGLALTFLAPPLLLLKGGIAAAIGGSAWLLMSMLYLPMVRFYAVSPLYAFLLPVTSCVYMWATLISAWRYHRGRGGEWKGRMGNA